ncbi:serine/threonine-protein kinase [Streptomyces sp. NPDC056161]|uniref:serine/threonine-protein kinase n=1 Tax=Streptomyces sp. NPDC056161 TaxID=3345732 RepID=UPI0035DBC36B
MSDDGADAPVADGRLIGGRYRLLERVGSGGAPDGAATGRVWRAVDEAADREVAVKQPLSPLSPLSYRPDPPSPPDLPSPPDASYPPSPPSPPSPSDPPDPRVANRLQHEARAAARVDHPSAVSILDVVLDDGLPWIVMELIHGESLDTVLRRGPLPPAETARIGLAVLGALRAAHAVGIVHRDVKPANVLIESGTDRIVLTDFGTWYGSPTEPSDAVDPLGPLGRPRDFLAPERMSRPGAGPASDLWSLGALLYVTVEGRAPFPRTTAGSGPGPSASAASVSVASVSGTSVSVASVSGTSASAASVSVASASAGSVSGTSASGTSASVASGSVASASVASASGVLPSGVPLSRLSEATAADPRPPGYERAGPLGPLLTRLLAREPADRPEPDEVAAALRAVATAERAGERERADERERAGERENAGERERADERDRAGERENADERESAGVH